MVDFSNSSQRNAKEKQSSEQRTVSLTDLKLIKSVVLIAALYALENAPKSDKRPKTPSNADKDNDGISSIGVLKFNDDKYSTPTSELVIIYVPQKA